MGDAWDEIERRAATIVQKDGTLSPAAAVDQVLKGADGRWLYGAYCDQLAEQIEQAGQSPWGTPAAPIVKAQDETLLTAEDSEEDDPWAQIMVEADRLLGRAPTLTREAAITKVCRDNPEMYGAYLAKQFHAETAAPVSTRSGGAVAKSASLAELNERERRAWDRLAVPARRVEKAHGIGFEEAIDVVDAAYPKLKADYERAFEARVAAQQEGAR